jgi:hypothetical protein
MLVVSYRKVFDIHCASDSISQFRKVGTCTDGQINKRT